jgi:hypothetical protein
MPPARRRRLLALLGWAACSACGELRHTSTRATPAMDASVADAGSPQDASLDVELGDGYVACDYDAGPDVAPCAPPSNDQLVATPATVTVAAGGYGVATFVATGPWTTDPLLYMSFESSTLPLGNTPSIMTYGTPQSVIFEVPPGIAGQTGFLTVTGHAGNIEVTTQARVDVTNCVPEPQVAACQGDLCGFQDDGCGGLESCGACTLAAPYCFLGRCVTSQPRPCPLGDGFDPDGGACAPCAPCAAFDSMCLCPAPPTPETPVYTDGGLPPSDAGGVAQCNPVQPFVADATHVACPSNQRCDFISTTQTRCDLPTGTGTQWVFCEDADGGTSNANCAAGYDCVNGATATIWCERYCRLGAGFDDCGSNYQCIAFQPPNYDGALEIGLCD